MREEIATTVGSYILSLESIETFTDSQRGNGASKDDLRQRRGFVTYLFRWLPENKELTRERLELWCEDMEQREYTQQAFVMEQGRGKELCV